MDNNNKSSEESKYHPVTDYDKIALWNNGNK